MIALRAHELAPTPWKNGAGTTTEYAIHPPKATIHTFDWRLSRAHVARNGPFSRFPGIERTLSVLSGAGLILEFSDRSVSLTPNDPPFTFSGDLPVNGRLIGGAIEDLNVMTRRGYWRQSVKRLTRPVTIEPGATAWLFALKPLHLTDPPLHLDRFDAVVLQSGASIAACPALLALISPLAPRRG